MRRFGFRTLPEVIPGSQTIDTAGSHNVVIPAFNTLTVHLYGPGGPGAGLDAGTIVIHGNIGTATRFNNGGTHEIIANPGGITSGVSGTSGVGGPGGTASGGDTNTSGQAGTDGGGAGNSNGRGGANFGPDGGAQVLTPTGTGVDGNDGNPYGSGGSGSKSGSPTRQAGGGGSGYATKTWQNTDSVRPAFGSSIEVIVGVLGVADTTVDNKFFGGDGAIAAFKMEWS